MKAIVYDTYGPPDVLRLAEIPKPVPGPAEVLVKVNAVSINSWDWDMLTGKPFEYRFFSGLLKPKYQALHGCDIAGEIEAVGAHVTQFKTGDEVFGDLSEDGWGAYAEYTCAPAGKLTLKPPGMTFEQAACLSHGGNLAVQGLMDIGRIQHGQKVLINGGGGTTGTLAIQIAKQFDVEITAVDRSEKLDMMRALGAHHIMDYTQKDFTRTGKQYNLIFDMKTNRSMLDYTRSLCANGTYVTVGGKTSRILQIALLGKLSPRHTMQLVMYKANKDVDYLVELFESGTLKPFIDRCYPLEKTADAFRYFGEGSFKGKIVIKPDHT